MQNFDQAIPEEVFLEVTSVTKAQFRLLRDGGEFVNEETGKTENSPGCFDDPRKTFADLYMKSGQYITEIVKRLYNSQGLKKAFPDSEKRIRHIFKHQVYGLAPTECIYRISLRYILGFDDTIHIDEADHHLRQADSLPAAKAGTMEEFLDEVF